MNKTELLRVADAVDAVSDNEFDMEVWEVCSQSKCGTVRCAVGSYCHRNPESKLKIKGIMPVYGNFSDWEAVAKFFRISFSSARNLFLSENYEDDSRKNVSKRIRDFVKDHS